MAKGAAAWVKRHRQQQTHFLLYWIDIYVFGWVVARGLK
jgi:hypothetical protein